MDPTSFGALLVLTRSLETRGRPGVAESWTGDNHEWKSDERSTVNGNPC